MQIIDRKYGTISDPVNWRSEGAPGHDALDDVDWSDQWEFVDDQRRAQKEAYEQAKGGDTVYVELTPRTLQSLSDAWEIRDVP